MTLTKQQRKEILKRIEAIQKFIEEVDSKDSRGRKIGDFDKLCFIQEDLTKLKELIEK